MMDEISTITVEINVGNSMKTINDVDVAYRNNAVGNARKFFDELVNKALAHGWQILYAGVCESRLWAIMARRIE